MTITRCEYLDRLRREVSDDERKALEADRVGRISRYNRATMLRLLSQEKAPDGTVDTAQAEGLRLALAAYLRKYMPEDPSAHKWIILCCLYLAMVVREPMHPREMARWQQREDGNYYCPAREDTGGSVCRWCVCRGM